MPRVVHFEIHSDDPERCCKFYSDVFGWKINKWDGPMEYWLVSTGDKNQPGIDGGIMRRTDPSGSTCNIIDVPSVDEFAAKVQAHGGDIVVPKQAIPGVGWLAYCRDTEGNVFGVMQEDASAK